MQHAFKLSLSYTHLTSHVTAPGLSPPSVGYDYVITDDENTEMAGEYKVISA